MRQSISLRLSVMFAAVSLIVFTLVGVGLFAMMQRQLLNELRATLDTRGRIATLIVAHTTTLDKWLTTQEKLADLSAPDSRLHYYVESPDPRFRYGEPIRGKLIGEPVRGCQTIQREGSDYYVVLKSYVVPASGERPAVTLFAASECERTQRMLHRFGVALGILIAGAMIVVLVLSRAVTRFGLAPLERLSKEASQLSPVNRRQRLQADALPGELRELAVSFNGALERLDRAYARLESFNADVAHELRTPISILIGQSEVALSRERASEQLRQTLQSNLEEFERMRSIVNDMLFLARRDRGERAADLVEVSLAAEVSRTLEFLEIAFEDSQLRATLHGDARASVNKSLFGRAVSNLLLNAMEHSRAGTTIRISVAARGELVDIAVSNPGEPLDPAVRELLFDRFYRLQEDRSNSHENHGLGLSIVKAIAEMHNGSVFVRCEDGFNTFGFSVRAAAHAQAARVRADTPRDAFAVHARRSDAPGSA